MISVHRFCKALCRGRLHAVKAKCRLVEGGAKPSEIKLLAFVDSVRPGSSDNVQKVIRRSRLESFRFIVPG